MPLPTVQVQGSMSSLALPSIPWAAIALPLKESPCPRWGTAPPLRSRRASARSAPPADSPSGVPGEGPRGGGWEHLRWKLSRIQLLL